MSSTLKEKRHRFDDDVAAVLRERVAIDGDRLTITGPRLDRDLYQRVNKTLELLGGKWKGGKTQAHVFGSPARALIDAALEGGSVVNKKQTFQFFETPRDLAVRLVEMAGIPAGRTGMTVLEPSAGRGAIADVIRELHPSARLSCVELDDENIHVLVGKGYEVSGVDFLTWGILPGDTMQFDRIVMNPPFTNLQDADHVRHAYKLLAPGGRLVSVMSPSAFMDGSLKRTEFQGWFASVEGRQEDLPAGTFKQSGTNIATKVVVIDRA